MESIIVKKIVPPTQEGQESEEKDILKSGINQVIKELNEKGYFTKTEEEIDGYKVVTLKVDGLMDRPTGTAE